MNPFRKCATLFAVFLTVVGGLAACGGGSYSSDNNSYNPPPSVIIVAPSNTLSGAQENPPVLTAATGTADFSLDSTYGYLTGTVTTAGMTGTAAHIHLGEPGVNGSIIIPLAQTAPGSGIWTVPLNAALSGAQITAFNNGGLYVNVHSDLYPNGQIRGQIGRAVLTTRLTGSQESPPTTSVATGTGVFSVNPATHALSARVVTSGISGTVAHIHIAPVGTSAPAAIAFNETAPGSGIWAPPANTVLTDTQYASMISGGTYFNVHSAALPNGEIRGQIGLDVTDVSLVGAQEVPPVVGGGSATARIIVNPATRELSGAITNIGVDATAGHIHNGLFGVSTPALIPATQSATGSPVWNLTPTTLTVAQYRELLFGNMYINTHSATFPNGEARAQIGRITRTGLLTGANEVPATGSSATGIALAELNADTLDISVTITTTGIVGTDAHLHLGAAGVIGGAIVPLTQGPTNTWTSAPGAKLTQAQAVAFAAGDTYFNVHSAAFTGGEIRAQANRLD